jgi:DNA-binding MarR family transcriptional regulator
MVSSPQSPRAEAKMTRPTPPTDPLVEAITTRLRRVDLVAWQRIAAWAEKLELSFEDLRLLLALRIEDGPIEVSALADLAGLPLDAAYPAIHSLRGRGYLREERRRYTLSEQGQELVAGLDAAHREGIEAYVDHLDPHERRRLEEAFGIAR